MLDNLTNITNETKKFLQICLNSIAHEVNESTCLATLYKELVCLALDCIFFELATVAVGKVEPYFTSVSHRATLNSDLTTYRDNIRNLIQNEEVDRELLLGQVYEEIRSFSVKRTEGIYKVVPTSERRSNGAHFTPRKLAKEVVEEAFRPWLEKHNYSPTVEQILDLKVCDPAVGGGVFLIESCHFLRHLLPEHRDNNALLKIISQCVYGVDKDFLSCEVTKMSLWLMARDISVPYSFIDSHIKCGDALVGCTEKEIVETCESSGLPLEGKDADFLTCIGDILVASHFNGSTKKERLNNKQEYLRKVSGCEGVKDLESKMVKELHRLRHGEKGVRPLHWQLAFPDVFRRENAGFDAFVGNPPFAGKNTTAEVYPAGILDWLKVIHKESHGNADLVAHFFRRCFDLLSTNGTFGLIATNTIAQGDTRSTGLRWICQNGGTIYSARKRTKWPGVAAVVVSVVHLCKGLYTGENRLDGQPVPQITAFLFVSGGHEDPKRLNANKNQSFQGSIVLGMGFTFDDSGAADDATLSIPSPIATMERLIAESPKNAEVIFPYIGGEEVNSSPTHAHHRYVINFGTRSEDECRHTWPELMSILERKVMDERLSKSEEVAKYPWWHHWRPRPELYAAIAELGQCLACARTSKTLAFSKRTSRSVYSENLVLIVSSRPLLPVLQSSIHSLWVASFSSTLGDGQGYRPSDCFETFPFPSDDVETSIAAEVQGETSKNLEASGENCHNSRAKLMVANNEGLTKTYNRFHDPEETSEGILELRRLHSEMDQAVLNAYGWSDVPTACGYGLDYLDLQDVPLPSEVSSIVNSGELFFWTAEEAKQFQLTLKKCGAIGKRKLPWRYRWPDSVRDDVLARLLALNAERYAEEVAMGLHP